MVCQSLKNDIHFSKQNNPNYMYDMQQSPPLFSCDTYTFIYICTGEFIGRRVGIMFHFLFYPILVFIFFLLLPLRHVFKFNLILLSKIMCQINLLIYCTHLLTFVNFILQNSCYTPNI